MNERVAIGGGIPSKGSGFIGEAVKEWQARGIDDAALKDELMSLWTRAEVLRLTNIRASQMRAVGNPGPEGSIGKRSEEHTSELQSLMRISYAVFCLKKKQHLIQTQN